MKNIITIFKKQLKDTLKNMAVHYDAGSPARRYAPELLRDPFFHNVHRYGSPLQMVFSFLPMLSMFNDTIKNVAKFTYSEQLRLLINGSSDRWLIP